MSSSGTLRGKSPDEFLDVIGVTMSSSGTLRGKSPDEFLDVIGHHVRLTDFEG